MQNNWSREDEDYMRHALSLAKNGIGHVNPNPMVGAILVKNGEIIGRGYHARYGEGHAEVNAFKDAKGDVTGATLYVTLEPCQMCAGAIVQARIPRVVIGCMNEKAGCAGSILNLLQIPQFNHQVEVTYHVLEDVCSTMLKDFFKELRQRNKKVKTPLLDK